MADALLLNAVPVAVMESRLTHGEVGGRERSVNGLLRLSRTRQTREWAFSTTWNETQVAQALRRLISGMGDCWRFDSSTVSARGLGGSTDAAARFRTREFLGRGVAPYREIMRPRLGTACWAVEPATENLLSANVATGTDADGNTVGFEACTAGATPAVGVTALSSEVLGSGVAKQGSRALLAGPDGTATQGVRCSLGIVPSDGTYALSAYVRAKTAECAVECYARVNAANRPATIIRARLDRWTRYETEAACVAGDALFLVAEDNAGGAGIEFRLDAIQIEKQDYATTWQLPGAVVAATPTVAGVSVSGDTDSGLYLGGWVAPHAPTSTEKGYFVGAQQAGGGGLITAKLGKANASNDAVLDISHATGAYISLSAAAVFGGREWHHLAVVLRRDPGTGEFPVEFWVDGVLAASSALIVPFHAQARVLTLGTADEAGTARPWRGLVDDLVYLPYAPPQSWVEAWVGAYGRMDSVATWQAATAYALGDIVQPPRWVGARYVCIGAGVSGASSPTWPLTIGGTVTDGAATWLYLWAAPAFPAPPHIEATGTHIAGSLGDGGAVLTLGELLGTEFQSCALRGGAWLNDAQRIAFKLADTGDVRS